MIYLKQSTASQEVLLGPFVDSTDGNTAETGLTIANTDIKVHKAGATTLANKNSGGATHISNGNYYAVFDATDTDTLGSGCIIVQVSGALAVRVDFVVLAANVYDSIIGGGDLLDVNTSQVGGTTQTAGDIIADTNDIQTRLPAALVSGRMDSSTGAMAANVLTATAINADAFTAAKFAADVTTEFQAGLATAAALDIVDNFLDTEIADIQARLPTALVGGRIDASVGAMAANTITASALATDAVDEIVDAVWDEVLTAATHNVASSAGRRLRQLSDIVVHDGTAQGPGTGTNQIQLDAGASAVDGAYDPAVIAIIGGTGAGQCRLILQYAGATRTATVDRDWKVTPDATSIFQVTANPGREHVNEGLAQAGGASTITLNTLASSSNDIYIGQMVFIRSGTGADQVGLVTAYNGTTKVATVDPDWAVVPDSTSAYSMLPIGPVLLGSVVHTGAVIPTVSAVTGLTASDVGAIKAKTDSLTFTVAGVVDSNIQRINDVAITGDGSGTPFNV